MKTRVHWLVAIGTKGLTQWEPVSIHEKRKFARQHLANLRRSWGDAYAASVKTVILRVELPA